MENEDNCIAVIDAHTKWCPEANVMPTSFYHVEGKDIWPQSSGNRIQGNAEDPALVKIPQASVCLGPGCMAWRWAKIEHTRFSDNAAGEGRVEKYFALSKTHGYCGKAGQP